MMWRSSAAWVCCSGQIICKPSSSLSARRRTSSACSRRHNLVDLDVTGPAQNAKAILGPAAAARQLGRGRAELAGPGCRPIMCSPPASPSSRPAFHRFSDWFDWIEFSRFIEGLAPRGRTLTTSTGRIVNLRHFADRCSGVDDGQQAGRTLAALVDDANGRAMLARDQAPSAPRDARHARSGGAQLVAVIRRGMWSARVATRTTRKAVVGDLCDLV